MAQIVDSYSESNYSDASEIYFEGYLKYAQSFTGDGGILESAKFYLKKSGSPTGNIYAKIYSHLGDFGDYTSAEPNELIATSDAFDVSTLTTTLALTTFTFSGVNKITLANGTYYFVSIEYVATDANVIFIGHDNTSPSHSGTAAHEFSSGNWSGDAFDFIFYIYRDDLPSTSPSSSNSPSSSLSPSASLSPSSSQSPSMSPSLSSSSSNSPSSSISPSYSPSASLSPSASMSPSMSPDVITINGIDRTMDIINQSIKIEDAINDKQNSCSFALVNRSGNGIPDTDDEIIITNLDGEIVFGGYILEVEMTKKDKGVVFCNISCIDYARLLDRNLVHKSYEDMTDKEIIEDIVNTYCYGTQITTNNVLEGVTIKQISFNYLQVSQVLKNLCKYTGRNWYIDYDKDIHYFPLETETSPFNIDSNNHYYFDLKLSKDNSQLRNRIYVRGGTKLSDFTDYITLGDGEKRQFVLPDKPHEVSVYVDTGAGYVEKTLGIKNIDTEGYDWYLNYQEKYIEQDTGGSVLTSSHKLKVTYKYDIPILVAVEDKDSIEDNGVQEFAVFDKDISTTESARDRASAELIDYSSTIVDGSFKTYVDGFKSGQYININLSDYGINSNYIIQSVISKSIGAGKFVYEIKIASAKTIGIINFLIGLLEANKNIVELDDDEVVDELLEKSDTLLSDSLLDNLTIDSCGPNFTWCVDENDDSQTRMRWGLFQWS